MKKEMICITCPIGCRLTLTEDSNGELQVDGNRCRRGKTYAVEEYRSPKRTVTASVHIGSVVQKRLPVRTDAPLPVHEITTLLSTLYRMKIHPPVKRGEILVRDFHGTSVNVIASMSLAE